MNRAAWWRRVQERAAQPLAAPRDRLCTPNGAAIGSVDAALALRIEAAGLPLVRVESGAWRVAGDDLDAALAAIARWLHREGLASRWRDEALAVTDEQGRVAGAIERAAVRPLGIATYAVHLVGLAASGDVWVQQRAHDKATDPGLWDTLMGGLVAAGESIEATLERETWEEAGLRLADLRDVRALGRVGVSRPVSNGYMVEHIEVYAARVAEGLVPVNQDAEVERFECLALDALAERLEADEFTLEAALVLGHVLPALRG